jgi:hypothetical protein
MEESIFEEISVNTSLTLLDFPVVSQHVKARKEHDRDDCQLLRPSIIEN